MGTIPYNVTIVTFPASTEPEAFPPLIQDALERVNQRMSTYISDSDVSKFNNSNSTEFQSVHAETAKVVQRSIEISTQTNGAFDITVGPAVNLWKFGPDKTELEMPSKESTDKMLAQIGFRRLTVRLDPPAIKKAIPELKIDLSAIAKGYAVDQVAAALIDAGCGDFMVEVGGEVFAKGERKFGGQWRVGVEKPDEKQRQIDTIAKISNRAMATSGDYRIFKTIDGKRYSHTIDPTTCRPVKNLVASACVIADDCMTADALATAMMVLGVEKGKKVCENFKVPYIFAHRKSDFDDTTENFISNDFPVYDPVVAAKNTDDEPSVIQQILPAFIGAIVVFALVILGMAVGTIFADKPVQGSCGGLANMTNEEGDEVCGVCSKPTTDCVEKATV